MVVASSRRRVVVAVERSGATAKVKVISENEGNINLQWGWNVRANINYASAKVSRKRNPLFRPSLRVAVVVAAVERGGTTAEFKVIPENEASHFAHCYL